MTRSESGTFIRKNTALIRPPHVPEIELHLASEAHDLWQRTEEELEQIGLPPPYWAFAWAGGQGLARYILDHPDIVRDKSVLDFASGSGLVAIASALSGAGSVTACDIDSWSTMATAMNARHNGVSIATRADDILATDDGWQIVLAGDVFYDQSLAETLLPWFEGLARRGAHVLIGDPGRSYCPADRLTPLTQYEVAVSRTLEDSEIKKTTVWQLDAR
ncbi:class I SAM-dependent methyltransferase [Hoeflea prorocentri]|uniref:Methyltransferase n=1 Tax=Hoeflea prorocentri TaxID=1922333 RepID=A0A9X3UQ31_9HYPH|nr:methyltransferase [Hoeflea prorocentri]MCY6383299.1 methyltransferase [Hoeflea prorocentri]MDA5401099.1 methyltransferase [Hoeflea prorocentri]